MKIIVLDKNETGNEVKEKVSEALLINGADKEVFVTICTNTFSFATYVYDECKGDIDLVIANVMGEKDDNIQVVRDVQNFFPHIQAIFYSDNNLCIESMFQACPTYFLKLPMNARVLRLALNRVLKNLNENRHQTLQIRSNGRLHKIRFNTIKYIESCGRKMEIYTNEGLFEVNMTMEEILGKLPEQFVQTHRSFIINTDKIVFLEGNHAELSSHEFIPVSRAHRKNVAAKAVNIK